MMQFLAPPLDLSGIAKLAQHRFERRTRVVLQAEGARDLAHAGLALVRADEGEKFLAGGEGAGAPRAFRRFFQDGWKLGPDRRNRQSGKRYYGATATSPDARVVRVEARGVSGSRKRVGHGIPSAAESSSPHGLRFRAMTRRDSS
jgi:hypothetical protein